MVTVYGSLYIVISNHLMAVLYVNLRYVYPSGSVDTDANLGHMYTYRKRWPLLITAL